MAVRGQVLQLLSHAEGDRARALALYEWNTEVSSAFLHDLAHLEVGLRNAYDRALIASTPDGRPHWVYDGHYTFPPALRTAKNGKTYDAHETARRDAVFGWCEAAAVP